MGTTGDYLKVISLETFSVQISIGPIPKRCPIIFDFEAFNSYRQGITKQASLLPQCYDLS